MEYQRDDRLVAAVQRVAGARCHRAANLLQCYVYTAELHRRAAAHGDPETTRAARQRMDESEADLRRFLAESRPPLGRMDPSYPDARRAWASDVAAPSRIAC